MPNSGRIASDNPAEEREREREKKKTENKFEKVSNIGAIKFSFTRDALAAVVGVAVTFSFSVLIPAIRNGLNHGAEARRRRLWHSGEHNLRTTFAPLFLRWPVPRVSAPVVSVSRSCQVSPRGHARPLHVHAGVVCHSQVLAKYARPFVPDLLFWQPRYSTLAANRIKRFCLAFPVRLYARISCTFRKILCIAPFPKARTTIAITVQNLASRERQFSQVFRNFFPPNPFYYSRRHGCSTRSCSRHCVNLPEKLLFSLVISLISISFSGNDVRF